MLGESEGRRKSKKKEGITKLLKRRKKRFDRSEKYRALMVLWGIEVVMLAVSERSACKLGFGVGVGLGVVRSQTCCVEVGGIYARRNVLRRRRAINSKECQ